MKTWLNTLLSEKGIDSEELLEVDGPSGTNMIPVGCLVDAILQACPRAKGNQNYAGQNRLREWKRT